MLFIKLKEGHHHDDLPDQKGTDPWSGTPWMSAGTEHPVSNAEGQGQHGGPRRKPGDGREPPGCADLTERDRNEDTGRDGDCARPPREHP